MRIWLLILTVLFGATADGLAQSGDSTKTFESPYDFRWKRELIYASGAGLVAAGGLVTRFQIKGLTPTEVNALDPFEIPSFDRPAIYNNSHTAEIASDVFLYGSMTLPAFLMIDKRMRKDFLPIGFIYAQTALLTFGVTELVKGAVRRPRPLAYNDSFTMELRTERDSRMSFFSGHTSITAALCFTTAKLFSDYSENKTHEALVWTAAALVPIATAYTRFEAGKHFPSDVIAGYFVGGAIGYLVPWLHRKKPLAKGLTLTPVGLEGGAGVYLSYRL